MTTLDERILIPAPQTAVWAYLSDLAKNPSWQADCVSVSFLTTSQSGPGVRWRSSGKRRRDYVLQITAWYDGLGYEYTYVDGASFSQSKGRIRLQEIPEGTIVQWSFTYELGGLLGAMRDSLGIRRAYNTMMIDSLKKLWLVMKHVNSGSVARETKSLMRDAPDVEARAQYKPRHPSAVEGGAPSSVRLIAEPPLSDEDTRPRPAVKAADLPPAASVAPAAPPGDPFARPASPVEMPPVSVPPPVMPIAPAPPASSAASAEPDFLAQVRATKDLPAVPPSESTPDTPAATQSAMPMPALTEKPAESLKVEPPAAAAAQTSDAVGVDTSKMSVFELFGLPKPSETQELSTVAARAPQPIAPQSAALPQERRAGRRGLRILLRLRRLKIRRP
ncbi:MAG: SRPBCC family protein [Chloroflexi bacterium]|nr:SRPBCC family protein [Chloroflexota bacterium]